MLEKAVFTHIVMIAAGVFIGMIARDFVRDASKEIAERTKKGEEE